MVQIILIFGVRKQVSVHKHEGVRKNNNNRRELLEEIDGKELATSAGWSAGSCYKFHCQVFSLRIYSFLSLALLFIAAVA